MILAGLLLVAAAVLLLLPWGIAEIAAVLKTHRAQAAESQAEEAQAEERQATESQAAERQAAEAQAEERQAAESQAAEAQAEERQSAEARAAEDRASKGQETGQDSEPVSEVSDGIKRVKGFRRFARGYYRFFVWTLLAVCLVMTLNCFILYHASTFSERYLGGDDGKEYSLEELMAVYNLVAGQCLALSEEMERDENGRALYTGSVGKNGEQLDMADKARELMNQMGDTYSQLDGYYPRPKAMFFSDFMCQQYMCGYYFPFSMEANYNDVMFILNIPESMCHELAHLRGFIYEDEANFISYLACVESDDKFFQYAGYLSVLTYLYNDLYRAWQAAPEAYAQAAEVMQPIDVTAQVWEDSTFVTEEEWERINSKALISTEIVDQASDVFIDTTLKVNGVSDGSVSYSRVVRLLLQYYEGKLENFAEGLDNSPFSM